MAAVGSMPNGDSSSGYPGGYYVPTPNYPATAPQPMTLPAMTPQQAAYLASLKHAQQVIGKKEYSALGGYAFDPEEVKFATQNPRERVFVMLRAHPITNLGWLVRLVIWALVPVIVLFVAQLVGFRLDSLPIPDAFFSDEFLPRAVAVLAVSYYAVLITTTILNFINWYFNIYLITNERVVDYNFKALVSYNIVEARLENIEDVKEKSVGFIPSVFQYGDILIKTAAMGSNFDFTSVPRPSEVRDVIADLSNFARRLFGGGRYYERRGE